MIRPSPLPEVAAIGVAPQAGDDATQLGARDAHPLEGVPGQLEGGLGFGIGHAPDTQALEGRDLGPAARSRRHLQARVEGPGALRWPAVPSGDRRS